MEKVASRIFNKTPNSMPRIPFLFILLFLLACKDNKRTAARPATPKDTVRRMLTYGLPDIEQERAMNTVAAGFGFRYYRVAGCVVSQRLIDSVEKENAMTSNKLAQRFGKDWEKHFAILVDTMYKKQMAVEALVRKHPAIVAKQQALEKVGDGLQFEIDPRPGKDLYDVSGYSWGDWEGDTTLVVYYKLTVDLHANAILSLQSTFEKF
jgi:hypothetical protein